MTIIKKEYVKSDGLVAEIEAQKIHQEMLEHFRSLSIDEFIREFIRTFRGMEFVKSCESIKGKMSILDIGVGAGQTSLYLALKGHKVTAVEPSPEFCSFVEFMAQKANVDIVIHESSLNMLISGMNLMSVSLMQVFIIVTIPLLP